MDDKRELDFIDHKDHILVDFGDGMSLIDTGCPSTVGRSLDLLGVQSSLAGGLSYFGVTIEVIGKLVNVPLVRLVGMDVLQKLAWKLDWEAKKITFYRNPVKFQGYKVPVITPSGPPGIAFKIGNEEHTALLDTGAPYSYCPEKCPAYDEAPVLECVKDFFPSIGEFSLTLREIHIAFGNRLVKVGAGKLPSPLKGLVSWWILGAALLKSGPIGFDLGSRAIYLLENGHA